jgi:CDP-paratose 2-epimerase
MKVMKVLITGGAGFIGTNAAVRFLERGDRVVVLDNLSRHGTKVNLMLLRRLKSRGLQFVRGDVRNARLVSQLVRGSDAVLHLAGQVAVTTSVMSPREDFEVNLAGTFNVLEAIRKTPPSQRPILLYTSTNKVYGAMTDLSVRETETRYLCDDLGAGVNESRPVDFHSPYGCSKGSADLYVRDYARVYGIPGVVFRMSCVYGPNQFGNEDQGWVAHFMTSAIRRSRVTIYGSGKQVRDLLYVGDLVSAICAVFERGQSLAGSVLNVGGGVGNTMSLLELLDWLEKRDLRVDVGFEEARLGDQPIYVTDTRNATKVLGWSPKVGVADGLTRLLDWLSAHRDRVQAQNRNRDEVRAGV